MRPRKEIEKFQKASAVVEKFIKQLIEDKGDALYKTALEIITSDSYNFKSDAKKLIKHERMSAMQAANTVFGRIAALYKTAKDRKMEQALDFVKKALLRQLDFEAVNKDKNALAESKFDMSNVVVSTYLSNATRPIKCDSTLIVNTNKLFLEQAPSVKEQLSAYKKIIKKNPKNPTAFILFNIDAMDQPKWLDDTVKQYGSNSLLIKGIRLGYIDQQIFEEQIKAIIMASAFTKQTVSILLPMVSTNEEYLVITNQIQGIYDKIRADKGDIEISVLFETPSMVVEPELVLNNADRIYLDIDSLTQYVLGVEKENQLFPSLNQPLNTSVLTMVQDLINKTHAVGKHVLIQGKSVNEPEVMAALIGLGAKNLVVSRYKVDEAEKLVKKFNTAKTYEIVQKCLTNKVAKDTVDELKNYIDSFNEN